jgi:hypothetical protein
MLFSESAIQKLVQDIASAVGASQRLQRTLLAAVRRDTLNHQTAPIVLQRLLQSGAWLTAIQLLSAHELQRRQVFKDDGLWAIVEKHLPSEESRAACRPVLRHVFRKSSMPTIHQTRSTTNK